MKKFRFAIIFTLSIIFLAPLAASATQCCYKEGQIDTGPDASGFKSADYCAVKTAACPDATTEVDCSAQDACKHLVPKCCIYTFTDPSTKNLCREDADQSYDCTTIQPTGTASTFKLSKCSDLAECTGASGNTFLSPATPAAAPATSSEYPVIVPKLSINIPTISMPDFTKVIQKDGYVYIPFISVYLVGAYKLGVGIAAILAVIMIMAGGFIWIASAGDAGRVGQAKKMISGAVVGMVLTVGSYVALQTINPNLVNFTALKIKVVARQTIDLSSSSNEGDTGDSPTLNAQNISCPKNGGASQIVDTVNSMSGKVYYRFGGSGQTTGFKETNPKYLQYNSFCPAGGICLDCSGFVKYVLACAGLSSPSGSTNSIFGGPGSEKIDQSTFSQTNINGKDLVPGDLVGWRSGEGGDAFGHVLIYVGNGQFAQSSSGSDGISGRENGSLKVGAINNPSKLFWIWWAPR